MSKIPANKDWSLINDEGSSEGSIKENHLEVEKEIDRALSDSQRLINEIKAVAPGQDIWIYYTNVTYSATSRDLEDYYRKKDIRPKRVLNGRDQGTFKVVFDPDNALKAASIPDNVPPGPRRSSGTAT